MFRVFVIILKSANASGQKNHLPHALDLPLATRPNNLRFHTADQLKGFSIQCSEKSVLPAQSFAETKNRAHIFHHTSHGITPSSRLPVSAKSLWRLIRHPPRRPGWSPWRLARRRRLARRCSGGGWRPAEPQREGAGNETAGCGFDNDAHLD